MKVVIHQTSSTMAEGMTSMDSFVDTYGDLENPQDDLQSVSDDCYRTATGEANVQAGTVPFTPSQFVPATRISYQRNMLSFVAFSLTCAVGLQIALMLYSHVQSADKVMSRLLAPIATTALGLAVAVAANFAVRRLSLDDESVSAAEWEALSTTADDSLEMSEMAVSSGDGDTGDAVMRVEQQTSALSMEERVGRPSIHQFMNVFDSARLPGVFACGPEPLMQQVRAVVGDRCLARMQQCIKGGSTIALYEESFQT
jgi:hypothetical protein